MQEGGGQEDGITRQESRRKDGRELGESYYSEWLESSGRLAEWCCTNFSDFFCQRKSAVVGPRDVLKLCASCGSCRGIGVRALVFMVWGFMEQGSSSRPRSGLILKPTAVLRKLEEVSRVSGQTCNTTEESTSPGPSITHSKATKCGMFFCFLQC